MMVKRKQDGTVDESSAYQEIYKSDATVRKSGGLHLVEPSPSGRLAVQQTK